MDATTAEGTNMDCEACNELLADFLLDELPEAEAVLVHEHLLICENCKKAYRDLKGTGKALDVVPAMAPVSATSKFREAVRSEARVESDKIVAKLPPEKRLRLEARREARQSLRIQVNKPQQTTVWSPGLLLLALAGAAVLALILLWPQLSLNNRPAQREPIGNLSVALGKVDQFYLKENQPHSPVAEGKSVMPGDAFTTGKMGRARFDLRDGGAIFMGPASDAQFRFLSERDDELGISVENGEIGVLRPDNAPEGAKSFREWDIRSDAGTLTFTSGTHAYAKLLKQGKTASMEVEVLDGCVYATAKNGGKTESLYAGQKALLSSAESAVSVESLSDERPPVWRIDLLTENDLAQLLGGKARILSRKAGRIQVELNYARGSRFNDWQPEPAGSSFTDKNGVLVCPTGIRLRHSALLAPPLSIELNLNAESRRDTSLAFGALEAPGMGVWVDVAREATLTVQEKGKLPHRDRIAARNQPSAPEHMVLEIKPEAGGFAASLSSAAGKTKALPLWTEKADMPGDIWFQALGDGLLLNDLKITGMISVEWLRERMSGAQ